MYLGLLLIPFNLICHMTMFRKLDIWPQHPQVPNPGAWPRLPNKNSILYVLYLSFVRGCTKFDFKIVEIDFAIEIWWYLTFWPLLKAPGGGDQKWYRCMCHSCKLLTHHISLIFWEKHFLTPNPPRYPPNLNPHFEKTHKVFFKIFEIDFVIEI